MIFMNLQVKFQVKAVAEPLYSKYAKELEVMHSGLQSFLVNAQTAIVQADNFFVDSGDDTALNKLAEKLTNFVTLAEHHLGGAKASFRKC